MATIQVRTRKNGKKSYRVMIRRDAHVVMSRTFRSEKEAQRFAVHSEDEIAAGKFGVRESANKHTLAETVERYVASEKQRGRDIAGDRLRHLRWWSEKLGNKTLAEITPHNIVALRDALISSNTKRGSPRKPATANRYLADLSCVFTAAVKDFGWIEVSPTARVRKLREPRGRVRFLSDDERSRLLAICRRWSEPRVHYDTASGPRTKARTYLLAIVLLALSTGMRRSEIERAKWTDIDWERRRLIIEQSKNDERRAVPLVGDAHVELTRLHEIRAAGEIYIFSSSKLGHRGNPRTFERVWKSAIREAALEDFRFHDLRHSCASYLAMSGSTLTDLAAVLGHKTLAMVKRYAHLTDTHVSTSVQRMSAIFIDANQGGEHVS